jgi:hypothetical protein
VFAAQLSAHLTELAELQGVNGIALVDCASGMVVTKAGAIENLEQLSEAAIEFWRLSQRLRANLKELQSLEAAALSFERGMMLLQPLRQAKTNETLVVVAIVTVATMDWNRWNSEVKILSETAARY